MEDDVPNRAETPGAGLVAGEDARGPRRVRVNLIVDQAMSPEVRAALQGFIARLTVPQKTELATKGNREVRALLSRDPSSLVARAVMASPRLAEADVVAYAASPRTNEEILRGIADAKEWARHPRVQVLLVSNPRTPPTVALRILGYLPVNEVNLLSKNRNVSAVVRREAKRRLALARR